METVLINPGERIRAIRHEVNMGFAVSCNDGAAIADGDFLVFLNNDTIPQAGWLDALLHYAIQYPEVAIVGAKLLYPNNTIQHAGIVFHDNGDPRHVYAGFPANHPAVNVSRRFQAVTAACALVRRPAFEQVAGFDTVFRNGYEDVDLCLRLGALGADIHYCHESVVYHLESVSDGRRTHDVTNYEQYRSRWAHRVRQDAVQYYVDDNLLKIAIPFLYPTQFTISPLLGTISGETEQETDQVLNQRAEQVFSLLRENIDLRAGRAVGHLDPMAIPFDNLSRVRLRAFLATRQQLVFPQADNPRVSIVVPLFNAASSTYAMLESLRACDSVVPYEVILVNDGSMDETPQLLEQIENVHVCVNEENMGFGKTCNRGAMMARGEYVCFLNSDTVVTPGWLDALVDVSATDSRCGAVGAKLISPNGRLQEAGSIIWSDGATTGYGRGADPFDPEYSYVREVDYCSAACLLVRRDLFNALGGFDDQYAPAYYEDVDLCMSIRGAGYTIVYAPCSVVFHLEHASSGHKDAMRLQERNRAYFISKWAASLLDRGEVSGAADVAYRDRRSGRRLLVIDDAVPVKHFGRGLPRTRALVGALTESGYIITYLPVQDPAPHEPITAELQRSGIEVLHSVTDPEAAIRARYGLYDVAIISRPHHAHLIDIVRQANPGAAIVYDAEAVFAMRDVHKAAAEGVPLLAHSIASLTRSELGPVGSTDLVLTVTETERRIVQRYHPQIPAVVWGNAMPLYSGDDDLSVRRDLLFVGYLGSPHNSDAVRILLEEIYPGVCAVVGCPLHIVGMDPPPDVQAAAYADDRVILAGYVEDLTPVYAHSRVFVAPHRWAAGIPIKVLEAMAHGVPCVISRLLGEQLGIADGDEALVATDASDFVEKTIRLMQDDSLWERIRESAREHLRTRYDPQTMANVLRHSIDNAFALKHH